MATVWVLSDSKIVFCLFKIGAQISIGMQAATSSRKFVAFHEFTHQRHGRNWFWKRQAQRWIRLIHPWAMLDRSNRSKAFQWCVSVYANFWSWYTKFTRAEAVYFPGKNFPLLKVWAQNFCDSAVVSGTLQFDKALMKIRLNVPASYTAFAPKAIYHAKTCSSLLVTLIYVENMQPGFPEKPIVLG